jgi:hypothetical protein
LSRETHAGSAVGKSRVERDAGPLIATDQSGRTARSACGSCESFARGTVPPVARFHRPAEADRSPTFDAERLPPSAHRRTGRLPLGLHPHRSGRDKSLPAEAVREDSDGWSSDATQHGASDWSLGRD